MYGCEEQSFLIQIAVKISFHLLLEPPSGCSSYWRIFLLDFINFFLFFRIIKTVFHIQSSSLNQCTIFKREELLFELKTFL